MVHLELWACPQLEATAEMLHLVPGNTERAQVVRLGEIVVIHDLKRQGLSVSAIARQVGLDRKTVRRYLDRGLEPPVYGPRAPRPRQLAPYEVYLRERVTAYPGLSATG